MMEMGGEFFLSTTLRDKASTFIALVPHGDPTTKAGAASSYRLSVIHPTVLRPWVSVSERDNKRQHGA